METNLEENFTKLKPYYNDIVLTEFSHWSKNLKGYAFCKPIFSQEISPQQLHRILLLNPAYRRFSGERIDTERPAFFDIPAQAPAWLVRIFFKPNMYLNSASQVF